MRLWPPNLLSVAVLGAVALLWMYCFKSEVKTTDVLRTAPANQIASLKSAALPQLEANRDGLVKGGVRLQKMQADVRKQEIGLAPFKGDPWTAYSAISDEVASSEKKSEILNYLMNHLDDPTYRLVAQKIINKEFAVGTPLYYQYEADYMAQIGENAAAKRLYDEYVSRFGDSDHVSWQNAGAFYMKTGEYSKALKCFESERSLFGKRTGVTEDVRKEVIEYLDNQILKARNALESSNASGSSE